MKLREITNTRQRPGEPLRRWFSGEELDLYVWIDDAGEIVSFQLTYDKPHSEKALVWKKDEGFSHLGVDEGFRPGKHPGSPLLVPDGRMNSSKIINKLMAHGDEVDSSIKAFIISGIESQGKTEDGS